MNQQRQDMAALIVTAARGWIGTPYVHQASLKGVGCDCLGLLRGVWREVMGREPALAPPYSPDWAEASGREALAEAAREHLSEIDPSAVDAGDVILFRWREGLPAKHCAIAAGPAIMIHAHDGASVTEAAIGSWWRRHIAYAFRFPQQNCFFSTKD
jgi:NlpC/P60 family putative phage cell wall peptidase